MRPDTHPPVAEDSEAASTTSLLILEDGRVLARNVTPALAALLLRLQPEDPKLQARVTAAGHRQPSGAASHSSKKRD